MWIEFSEKCGSIIFGQNCRKLSQIHNRFSQSDIAHNRSIAHFPSNILEQICHLKQTDD